MVTSRILPSQNSLATPARGFACSRNIAPPRTKAKNLPQGRFFTFGARAWNLTPEPLRVSFETLGFEQLPTRGDAGASPRPPLGSNPGSENINIFGARAWIRTRNLACIRRLLHR